MRTKAFWNISTTSETRFADVATGFPASFVHVHGLLVIRKVSEFPQLLWDISSDAISRHKMQYLLKSLNLKVNRTTRVRSPLAWLSLCQVSLREPQTRSISTQGLLGCPPLYFNDRSKSLSRPFVGSWCRMIGLFDELTGNASRPRMGTYRAEIYKASIRRFGDLQTLSKIHYYTWSLLRSFLATLTISCLRMGTSHPRTQRLEDMGFPSPSISVPWKDIKRPIFRQHQCWLASLRLCFLKCNCKHHRIVQACKRQTWFRCIQVVKTLLFHPFLIVGSDALHLRVFRSLLISVTFLEWCKLNLLFSQTT